MRTWKDEVKYLQKNKIPIVKYNYSLDKDLQRFFAYDGTLQLSEDASTFIITNKKPVFKQDGTDIEMEDLNFFKKFLGQAEDTTIARDDDYKMTVS